MHLTLKEKKFICIALAVLAIATTVLCALVVFPLFQYQLAKSLAVTAPIYGSPAKDLSVINDIYQSGGPSTSLVVVSILQMVATWIAFGISFNSLNKSLPYANPTLKLLKKPEKAEKYSENDINDVLFGIETLKDLNEVLKDFE